MKIRNGFVSNSSSSSFIIAVEAEPKTCPTCGHKPQNIVDILDSMGNCNYHDDSSIDDIEEYIRDNLDYERNATASWIEELKQRDPDELTHPRIPHSTQTVRRTIELCEEEVAKYEAEIAKYRQMEKDGKKLYHLQISYHDNLAQHILDDCVKQGIVTIVRGD